MSNGDCVKCGGSGLQLAAYQLEASKAGGPKAYTRCEDCLGTGTFYVPLECESQRCFWCNGDLSKDPYPEVSQHAMWCPHFSESLRPRPLGLSAVLGHDVAPGPTPKPIRTVECSVEQFQRLIELSTSFEMGAIGELEFVKLSKEALPGLDEAYNNVLRVVYSETVR